MSWYSIDAVDGAITRTRKALIEPFNFWKWIKLGIIIALIGGGGGYNFNPGSYQYGPEDTAGPSIEEIRDDIIQFWQDYMPYILLGLGIFLILILIFGIISNVMEFVLVASLVSNLVTFWAYSRKYLRQGFNLFIVRLVLALIFLSLFILMMLPLVLPLLENPEAIMSAGIILKTIIWLFAAVLVIAIASGIIQSFINLSIPLVMYNELGVIAAFRKVLGRFRSDWKQIIVYWVVRFIIGLVAGIIVFIAAMIIFLIVIGILAVIGAILYFGMTGMGLAVRDALFLLVMIPYALIALIIFMIVVLIVSVPVPVFMKYHMLTFLKAWYPEARIAFFDQPVD